MQDIRLFKNIPEDFIETTIKALNGRKVDFKKDMTILSNMSNANEVGIILKGSASLIRIDYNGNRSIAEDLNKNDIFGGCFSDYMNEEMFVIANTDCEVLFVEYDRLLGKNITKIPNHEILIENTIEVLVKKVTSYNKRIEILNKRSIRDKLLEYFHTLEHDFAKSTFTIPYTYTSLADYLAVDRSAMMREIKNLKDDGLIEVDGKKITLIYR